MRKYFLEAKEKLEGRLRQRTKVQNKGHFLGHFQDLPFTLSLGHLGFMLEICISSDFKGVIKVKKQWSLPASGRKIFFFFACYSTLKNIAFILNLSKLIKNVYFRPGSNRRPSAC